MEAPEDENRRLKAMVADLSFGKETLKAVIRQGGCSLPGQGATSRSLWSGPATANERPASSWSWTEAHTCAAPRPQREAQRRTSGTGKPEAALWIPPLVGAADTARIQREPEALCRPYRQERLTVQRLKREHFQAIAQQRLELVRANQDLAVNFASERPASGRGLHFLTFVHSYTVRSELCRTRGG